MRILVGVRPDEGQTRSGAAHVATARRLIHPGTPID
jgi:hypothetical protein